MGDGLIDCMDANVADTRANLLIAEHKLDLTTNEKPSFSGTNPVTNTTNKASSKTILAGGFNMSTQHEKWKVLSFSG